jgi:hypothetical protein
MAAELRRLRNEELHNFHASPRIIRMRWARHVARIGEQRNAYSIFVGKSEL